jgi:hypothetical protein
VLPWPRKDGDATPADPANLADANVGTADDGVSAMTADAIAADGNSAVTSHGMSRTSGAGVVLINGSLTAFLRRRSQEVQVFLPESEPERTRFARELAKKFAEIAIQRQGGKTGFLIGTINAEPARQHFMARFLEASGFVNTAVGFQMRRITPLAMPGNLDSAAIEIDEDSDDEEILSDANSDAPETA